MLQRQAIQKLHGDECFAVLQMFARLEQRQPWLRAGVDESLRVFRDLIGQKLANLAQAAGLAPRPVRWRLQISAA